MAPFCAADFTPKAREPTSMQIQGTRLNPQTSLVTGEGGASSFYRHLDLASQASPVHPHSPAARSCHPL